MQRSDNAEALINNQMPELALEFEKEALEEEVFGENKQRQYSCGESPSVEVE